MIARKAFWLMALMLVATQTPVLAQRVDPASDLGQFRAHRDAAMQAFERASYSTALTEIQAAKAILPDSPSALLVEAQTYLEQRNTAAARDVIYDYVSRGYVLDLTRHPEFNLVWDAELTARQAENQKPHGELSPVAVMPGFQVQEGIAFHPDTQEIFITTLHTGTVTALTTQGPRKVIGFRPGVAAYGIAYHNGSMWVTTAASKLTQGFNPDMAITSKVLSLDPQSGKITATFADADPQRVFSRIVAGREDLYVIDTNRSEVLRLRGYQGQFETLLPEGYLDSPQSLTENEAGDKLIIADFVSGLYMIDLNAGKLTHLKAPSDGSLMGLSHLSRHGNDLIAIQTGFRPTRILRLTLSDDWRTVNKAEVLVQADTALSQPTQGMVVGDNYVFIARSQWDHYDDQGVPRAGDVEPAAIAAIRLK